MISTFCIYVQSQERLNYLLTVIHEEVCELRIQMQKYKDTDQNHNPPFAYSDDKTYIFLNSIRIPTRP